jgi:5-methyltetrahydropteroyltriglutamate--homocysteine methyltransferase
LATNHHAEHVGSLLRPPWLLEARAAHEQGTLTDERLRELEDRAVLEAIELQRQAGVDVYTDGEMRRDSWRAGLMESLDGVVPAPRTAMKWYRDGKELPPDETLHDGVAAAAKVTRKDNRTSVEAAFMLEHAPGPFKVTMISASYGGIIWAPKISAAVYPAPADLIHDLQKLQIEEIEGLIDQGVRWIQLDSLAYNRVIDPAMSDGRYGSGPSPEDILDATVRVDAGIVRAAKRKNPDVTVGMHICRGNYRSSWMAKGSYEPVAERLFGEVGVDRFLLEYDSERAGGFEPLRFVPKGTTVVLGLVTTKVPKLESQDDLCRRIEEAARFVPAENLAISPQCGFASGSEGNLLSADDELRKLELVASTARKVWG